MPRLNPRPDLRRPQLPRLFNERVAAISRQGAAFNPQTDFVALADYVTRLGAAMEGDRHEFKPKVHVGLSVDQATTTALAAVSWETELYDNGGWWDSSAPTQLSMPLAGVLSGVFQTKLSGSGTLRVQLAINGTDEEYGVDVTLAGDFTFAFPWQLYLNQGDYIEVKVSTGSSRNLVAAWTHVHMIHHDYLEEV